MIGMDIAMRVIRVVCRYYITRESDVAVRISSHYCLKYIFCFTFKTLSNDYNYKQMLS